VEAIQAKQLKAKVLQHTYAPELTSILNSFLKDLDGEVISVQFAADAGCLATLVLYTEAESSNEETASG
jgi:hypothetical protein